MPPRGGLFVGDGPLPPLSRHQPQGPRSTLQHRGAPPLPALRQPRHSLHPPGLRARCQQPLLSGNAGCLLPEQARRRAGHSRTGENGLPATPAQRHPLAARATLQHRGRHGQGHRSTEPHRTARRHQPPDKRREVQALQREGAARLGLRAAADTLRQRSPRHEPAHHGGQPVYRGRRHTQSPRNLRRSAASLPTTTCRLP